MQVDVTIFVIVAQIWVIVYCWGKEYDKKSSKLKGISSEWIATSHVMFCWPTAIK